ncbi:MAG: beta-ketoacyl synthase chain length factor [Bacteroidetes bacterium]|nr:beta-ketoacyl synthase chain length factor [Bacteroidota bacterium]
MTYINGIGCISPQNTFRNDEFLKEVKEYATDKMLCIDPDYTKFLDPGAVRRMGRLLKFGTTAGLIALRDAGVETPGAISTATGFGLLDLSQKFLADVIATQEGVVSPTSFILSTHNTVSSNIALLCGCHAHNNTFSQRGFSFESALTDTAFMLQEGKQSVLIGAYDEVGQFAHAKFKHVGELRQEPCTSSDILSKENPGVIMGEGAAFFVLSKDKTANSYGSLSGHSTLFNPENADELRNWILDFLTAHQLQVEDIDVAALGYSGATKQDALTETVQDLFKQSTITAYKHLCGEYMTASAFGFWLACKMMKTNSVPDAVIIENRQRSPRVVLVYNSYKRYHSLMLFHAC